MRYLYSILLLIVIGCSSGGGTTGTGGYRYSGTILSDSGTPVSNVDVTLEDASGTQLNSTKTSTDGSFEFSDVDISDAVIQINKGKPNASEIMVTIPKDKDAAAVTVKRRPDGKFNKDEIKFEKRPKKNNDNKQDDKKTDDSKKDPESPKDNSNSGKNNQDDNSKNPEDKKDNSKDSLENNKNRG